MIPYIGNKSSLSDFILPECPKNPRYWIEPFGGMMGLFFSLDLRDYPNTKFIYNDINPLNCDLIESLKDEDFIQMIKETSVDLEVFLKSFDMIQSEEIKERSLNWLIILCCGDMKDLFAKDFRGGSSFETIKFKVDYYKDYFERIKVERLDYKKLIKKYDSRRDVFFYLDPPYKNFEKYYVNHNFDDSQHLELSDLLKNINSNWILSYYKFDELKDWYSDYQIKSKKHNLSTEYLIINN